MTPYSKENIIALQKYRNTEISVGLVLIVRKKSLKIVLIQLMFCTNNNHLGLD